MSAIAVGIAVVVWVRRLSRPDTLAVFVVWVWRCEQLTRRCRRARSARIEDHELRLSVQIHGRHFERIQAAGLACDARAVLIALLRTDDEKLADIDPEVLLSTTPAVLVPV
jgi:hypothetical protein